MSTRRHPRHPRRTASTAAAMVGTLALAGSLAGVTSSPARAASSATAVTFTGCDLENESAPVASFQDQQIGMTIDLDIPSPHPLGQAMSVEVDGLTLPAGMIPQALDAVEIKPYLYLTNDVDPTLIGWTADDWVAYAGFDAGAPTALADLTMDVTPNRTGIYSHAITDLEVYVYGEVSGEPITYLLECNTVSGAPVALTTAVYDLNAAPTLTARPSATQGELIQISGQHLLAAAPTVPAAQVEVFAGSDSLGLFGLDDDGSFSAQVQIPDTARKGPLELRAVNATNAAKAASTTITVKLRKARLSATPAKVKVGKKVRLNGAGFVPGERVKLTLRGKGKGKRAFKAAAKADASGTFVKAIKLRKAAKGRWNVVAKGVASTRTGKATFRVR